MTVRRCPVCLRRHALASGVAESCGVTCAGCGKSSRWGDWLPSRELPTDAELEPASVADPETSVPLRMLGVAALLVAIVWLASYLYMFTLKGPDFIVFYLLLLGGIWLAVLGAKAALNREWLPRIAGLIAFEGVGAIRLVTGLMAGMHTFDLLLIMMLMGGCSFLLKAQEGGGDSSGWGVGSACSGGGCGGGGCGGGGCGGCGGS